MSVGGDIVSYCISGETALLPSLALCYETAALSRTSTQLQYARDMFKRVLPQNMRKVMFIVTRVS